MVISVNFLHQLTLHVEDTCNNRITTPFNTIWSRSWFAVCVAAFYTNAQILSFCLTAILPEIRSVILILPDNSTLHNRQAAACNTSHDFNLLKTSGKEFVFFRFLEESWFWTEGGRGLKQVGKRISFQSLCLDMQLKFDQYLSMICVCIYSSRFC